MWLKVVMVNYLTRDELESLLMRRFQIGAINLWFLILWVLLNKKLVPVILKEAGIEDINKPAGSITIKERNKILDILKDWRFEVIGTNSWSSAQVTAGGIDVKEINGKTMESKIVPGLYFAGEIVDIDGDCGGYNLQWAWSTGFVAGENASKAIE